MAFVKKMLFFDNKNIKKQSMLWNLIASVLNAGISAYMLMIITRFIGVSDGGIFAIAATLGYQFLTIGCFGMRNYQATDTNNIYSFKEYLVSRYITSILMILTMIVFILYKNYDLSKSLVVIAFVLFKWIDAYEDVYHGFYQQNDRLDVACREQSYRYIFSLLFFTIIIILTKNLFVSCLFTFIFSLIFFIVINNIIKQEFIENDKFNKKNVLKLLRDCFPLFLSTYLYLYICNSPKYAIDAVLNDSLQSYFGILFMPVFVINLISTLVYRPILTKLAVLWNTNKISELKQDIFKQLVIILVFTLCAVIFAYFIGTEVLGLIYGVDLSEYKTTLSLLMIGGGLNAVVSYLLSIITIIRAQNTILPGYIFVSILAIIFSNKIVKNYSLMGASVLYDILTLLLTLYFIIIFVIKYKKSHKR